MVCNGFVEQIIIQISRTTWYYPETPKCAAIPLAAVTRLIVNVVRCAEKENVVKCLLLNMNRDPICVQDRFVHRLREGGVRINQF